MAGNLYLKNGYVFYDRLKNDAQGKRTGLWKKIYSQAVNDINSINVSRKNLTWGAVADYLTVIGNNEQEKERRLLSQLFGAGMNQKIEFEDYPAYIGAINTLVGMGKKYGVYLKNLKKSFKSKSRAPLPFSYFESYLTSAISEVYRNFLYTREAENIMIYGTPQQLQDELDKRLIDGIKLAIKKVSEQSVKIDDEELKLWSFIADSFNSLFYSGGELNPQGRQLINLIISSYGLNNISSQIANWRFRLMESGSKLKTTRGLSNQIKSAMNIGEMKGRSVAGFLQEYVAQMIPKDITVNESGAVLQSNIAKTDSVSLFSLDTTIDLQQQADALNEYTQASKSLNDFSNKITKFYEDYLKKLEEVFIVYRSTKAYSFFDNRGLSGGVTRRVADIGEVIGDVGGVNGKDLANLLYQTIPGAIAADNSASIREDVTKLITAGMANTLFDDWYTIGEASSNSIHMFDINAVQIPLSYLCLGAARAIQSVEKAPTTFFKVTFNMPKNIMYPHPEDSTAELNGTDMTIYDLWNKQAKEAYNNSTFRVEFMRNFKSLITDCIREI